MPHEELTCEDDDKETMAGGSTVNSIHHDSSLISKEKCLFHKGIRNVNLQETHEVLRTRKLIDKRHSDQHEVFGCSSVQLVQHRKPWPSSKASSIEGLVKKHMSNISQNLHPTERVDNVQAKSFKVGILDWGLLERWKYHQKCVANGGSKISKSINSKSSWRYTFGSSTQCSKSTCKALPQQEKAGHFTQFHDPRASTISSTGHAKHHDADSGIIPGCQMKEEYSLHVDSGTSYATSNIINHRTSPIEHKIIDTLDSRSRNEEKFLDFPHNLDFMGNWQKLYHDTGNIWDQLQESAQMRRNSFDSSYFDDGMLMVRKRNSFSVFLSENDKFVNESPYISHSLPIRKSKCQNGNQKQFAESSFKQLVVHAARAGESERKAPTETGKESSNHQSHVRPKWMVRSASLREGLSGLQVGTIDGNKEPKSNGGRRSPLRRMLDPLLKPKSNMHFSGPIAASHGRNSFDLNENGRNLMYEELASSYYPLNSSKRNFVFTCPAKDTMNTSNLETNNSGGSLHYDRHDSQTRQGLLQFAWKNGLPLFMFSSSDEDILAATMTNQSAIDEDDSECIYIIFRVHGYKKKTGAWINLGKKSKRHQLVSDVIGKVNVSSLRNFDSQNRQVTREFVLLGAEPAPTSHEPVDFSFNSELAAIVVKVQEQIPGSCNLGLLRGSNCRSLSPTILVESADISCQQKSLPTDHDTSISDQYNVVVALPSGIHGSSTDGKPSTLIERWRSGGNCDCGGWDEGCRLTLLSNKYSAGSFQDGQTIDGNYDRVELFLRSGCKANGHDFRMVSLKEGLYTVEFGTSITWLQAFAICLATLHSRRPANHSADPKRLLEHIGSPTGHVPYCPPLSPVGRA